MQSLEDTHYTSLYDNEYFRTRVLRLQALCAEKNLDGVLLATGIDTWNDPEMKRLTNWLLFGLTSTDINGSLYKETYDEAFFVISKDAV